MNIQRTELEVNESADMGAVKPMADGFDYLLADAKLISGTWATAVIELVYSLADSAEWRSFVPPQRLTPGVPYTAVPVFIGGRFKVGAKVTTVEGAAGRVAVWLSLAKAPG